MNHYYNQFHEIKHNMFESYSIVKTRKNVKMHFLKDICEQKN